METKKSNIIIAPVVIEKGIHMGHNIQLEQNSILNRSSMMTYSKIVCCLCGVNMDANPRGICQACDQKNVNITEGIPRNFIMDYCKLCDRYLRPPWMRCQLESAEMMALCLSKVKSLTKAKIVDSSFIWTEPHSKQIKVKITIQKEHENSLVSTSFVLEYKVNWTQCEDCKKTFTPHKWNASVQIRQKVKNKLTFLYLEQLVLKHKMHLNALNIKELPEGVDFYFLNKTYAIQFTEFICGLFSCRVKQSKQVISTDLKSNTQNSKLSYMIEIAPICKDELIILNEKQRRALGGIGPLVLCDKLSSKISLVDPITFKRIEIDSHTYWKYEFRSYIDRSCLKEFLIIDCEEEIDYKKYSHHHQQQGNNDNNQEGVDITESINSENISLSTNYKHDASQSLIITTNESHIKIAKCMRNFNSDNQDMIEVRTHIAAKMYPGDIILGYDFTQINLGDATEALIRGKENSLPDVILVKKKAGNSGKNKKKKLKHFDIEKDVEERDNKKGRKNKKNEENDDNEYEEFINEIHDDQEMMNNVCFEDQEHDGLKDKVGDIKPITVANDDKQFIDGDEDIITTNKLSQVKKEDGSKTKEEEGKNKHKKKGKKHNSNK